jgi:hypothetical protein
MIAGEIEVDLTPQGTLIGRLRRPRRRRPSRLFRPDRPQRAGTAISRCALLSPNFNGKIDLNHTAALV